MHASDGGHPDKPEEKGCGSLPSLWLVVDSGISKSTTTRYFWPRARRVPLAGSVTLMIASGLVQMPGRSSHALLAYRDTCERQSE